MDVDWRRLRAVVIESDDWGLCAWVPDEQAHAALRDLPAFGSPSGARYGRSTLETAGDVRQLADLLLGWRGGDGFPPVLQANTVVANPDYDAMRPPFALDEIPILRFPDLPARWRRIGLADAVRDAEAAGVWWAELHGLHHLPEGAWLGALRRGDDDAIRAWREQSPIGVAVEASGEYDDTEPRERRARSLQAAIRAFRSGFGRAPASLCPPDYRFDDWLEGEAARLGIAILQGGAEQAGRTLPQIGRASCRERV